jgi:hypothetical protein
MSHLTSLSRRLLGLKPKVTSTSEATIQLGGVLNLPASVRFRYTAKEPFAVRMNASVTMADAHMEWVFDRDLLIQGVDMPTGLGAVQVWPASPRPELPSGDDGAVLIQFRGPQGQVTLAIPAKAVREFVGRTQDAVPVGSESDLLSFDAGIDRLMDNAAGPGTDAA